MPTATDASVASLDRATAHALPCVPSVPKCMALLWVTKCSLRALGFTRTRRWMETRAARWEPSGERGAALAQQIDYVVSVAAAIYPGRALCLEQSLTLLYLLRRRGLNATLKLGARPQPFYAHAWVECDGEPVNDTREHLREFAVLPDHRP
jgi:hypothetical protein